VNLFVYGTLRRGNNNPHAEWLRANSRFVGEGSITGTLHRVGEYTGLVPGDGPAVHGEVFELHDPAEAWRLLDEYEGDAYERRDANVAMSDGRAIDATMYAYRMPAADQVRRRPPVVAKPF
jgi:gamma-glutamylcyclotransferase (GGCT)/AIG2-like uncharacterized protein YtfP